MAVYRKCETKSCHRRIKETHELAEQLRQTSQEAGGHRAGVLCPRCVAREMENTEKNYLDMSAGEILAESLVESPRWRIYVPAISPHEQGKLRRRLGEGPVSSRE